MVQAITNAQSYDWKTWGIGIMRSFLSGGAAAFISGTGAGLLEIPHQKIFWLMGINFMLMGLYRMGEFLQLHGAPDKLQQTLNVAAEANAQVGQAIAEAKSESTKPS